MKPSETLIRFATANTLVFLALGVPTATAQAPVGRFVDPKPVYDDSVEVFQPAVSDDGLTLYFSSRQHGGFGDADLLQATRTSNDELFTDVASLGEPVNSGSEDAEPFISSDGLTLYFNSNRPDGEGDDDLYFATRSSLDEPFGNVTNLGPQINTEHVEAAPYLSQDSLTLYFHSSRPGSLGVRDLYQATRNSTDDLFSNVTHLGDGVNSASRDFEPAVSADELTIFFSSRRPSVDDSGETDTWVATRDNTSEPFGAAVQIDEFSLGSDLTDPDFVFEPHLSADWPSVGSKIYYVQALVGGDFDIYEAVWVPEPSTVVLSALGLISLLVGCRRR